MTEGDMNLGSGPIEFAEQEADDLMAAVKSWLPIQVRLQRELWEVADKWEQGKPVALALNRKVVEMRKHLANRPHIPQGTTVDLENL